MELNTDGKNEDNGLLRVSRLMTQDYDLTIQDNFNNSTNMDSSGSKVKKHENKEQKE